MPSDDTYWKPHDAVHLERVVSSLVAARGPTGWAYSVEFLMQCEALRALVKVPDWIRSADVYALRAISEMARQGQSGLPQFQKEMKAELTKHREERVAQEAPCWLILPIRLPALCAIETPHCVRILGHSFGFMRVSDYREYLGPHFEHCDENTKLLFAEHTPPDTCVCVSAQGFPIEAAYDRVAPAFDALRGAMELSLAEGTMYMASSGWSRQGQICHPKHMICVRDGQPTWTLRFLAPEWIAARKPSTDSKSVKLFTIVEKFASHLRDVPPDNSTATLLGDLLRLYAQAMEED